jgi:hypothetical protein
LVLTLVHQFFKIIEPSFDILALYWGSTKSKNWVKEPILNCQFYAGAFMKTANSWSQRFFWFWQYLKSQNWRFRDSENFPKPELEIF